MDSRCTKRKLNKENSTRLWHKRLGHISKCIIEQLATKGILDSLDFSDLNVCVQCIKRKQTKHKRLGANRSSGVIKLIHTDICGPPYGFLEWSTILYIIHRRLLTL